MCAIESLDKDILDKNKDLLVSLVPRDLPDARGTDGSAHMSIPLIDGSVPVKLRPYSMSNAELRVLQELLKDLVEKGYIERCTNRSSWAAPIMLIRKGGNREGVTNQWGIVTDYRVIIDMHWVLRGGKPHWDTSFGRGTSLGWVEFCIMKLIWLPRIHN